MAGCTSWLRRSAWTSRRVRASIDTVAEAEGRQSIVVKGRLETGMSWTVRFTLAAHEKVRSDACALKQRSQYVLGTCSHA